MCGLYEFYICTYISLCINIYLSEYAFVTIEDSGSASAKVPPTMLLESLQELLECAQEMRHSEV